MADVVIEMLHANWKSLRECKLFFSRKPYCSPIAVMLSFILQNSLTKVSHIFLESNSFFIQKILGIYYAHKFNILGIHQSNLEKEEQS